jgi:hypothetical protein
MCGGSGGDGDVVQTESTNLLPVTLACLNMLKYSYGRPTRVYPKVSGLSRNEIYAYNNKHSLRSNVECYGGKTHYTDSQNNDTAAPSGRELYHLQFSLQVVSPETFGYTLVYSVFIETNIWALRILLRRLPHVFLEC